MTRALPVNSLSFDREVLQSELPVLVDVTADWCPPCKAAAPVIEDLAREHAGRLKVVVLDGGEAADLVATLGVRGFPTFLGVRRGTIVARQAGFGGRRGLERLAETLLTP
ncbi:MAG TPA: thioredoxin family protein [Polyangiaceae bacterium]|nr:thioredoxin family protein [Polyangiaceae bacterium]